MFYLIPPEALTLHSSKSNQSLGNIFFILIVLIICCNKYIYWFSEIEKPWSAAVARARARAPARARYLSLTGLCLHITIYNPLHNIRTQTLLLRNITYGNSRPQRHDIARPCPKLSLTPQRLDIDRLCPKLSLTPQRHDIPRPCPKLSLTPQRLDIDRPCPKLSLTPQRHDIPRPCPKLSLRPQRLDIDRLCPKLTDSSDGFTRSQSQHTFICLVWHQTTLTWRGRNSFQIQN